MIIKLSIIGLFAVLIILMAIWILRTEGKPKRKISFLPRGKSFKKAHEIGLKL